MLVAGFAVGRVSPAWRRCPEPVSRPGDITAAITGRRLVRWFVKARARELVLADSGHQPVVDPGAMAAKRMPGIKIGWFGH